MLRRLLSLLGFGRGPIIYKLKVPPASVIAGQTCGGCAYFDHCDPDCPPDEVDGYCSYPGHISYGKEYGGHWTHHASWCDGWTAMKTDHEN